MQSNGGPEFDCKEMEILCCTYGITHTMTPPYTPELHGIVERANGIIGNCIWALIYNADAPTEWWHLAADAAAYLINRSPHTYLNHKTPYKLWHGTLPNVSYIQVFGSCVRVLIPEDKQKKIQKRSWTGILVGYTSNSYKIYNPKTREIEKSRHVKIDKTKNVRDTVPNLGRKEHKTIEIETKYDLANIKNIIIHQAAMSNSKEITFDKAIRSLEAAHWRKAISDKLDIIKARNVWVPVNREKQKLIDTKWVFKKQMQPNGQIKYKAHFMCLWVQRQECLPAI